jgi:hypothetical protein
MLLVFAVAWGTTLFGRKQGKHETISEDWRLTAKPAATPGVNYTKLALELSVLDPRKGLEKLARDDPFGVHDVANFKCTQTPGHVAKRGDILDIKDSFILYQHISKAGGTSFCAMAMEKIPKGQSAANCEGPDGEQGRGAMLIKNEPSLPNQFKPHAFLAQARTKNLRIHANEWEPSPT